MKTRILLLWAFSLCVCVQVFGAQAVEKDTTVFGQKIHYVEAGSGPRLLALHDATKPQAERYVRLYITSLMDEIATSVGEHNVIVQAIDGGNGPAAQQAVDSNWKNAGLRLSHVIQSLGERGSW